jgi:hypothetical protein
MHGRRGAVALVLLLAGTVAATLWISDETVKIIPAILAALAISIVAFEGDEERRDGTTGGHAVAPRILARGLACAAIFAAVRALVPMDFTVRTSGARILEIALAFETGLFFTLPAGVETLTTTRKPTPRRDVDAAVLVFLAGALAWGLADLATTYTRVTFRGADRRIANELLARGFSQWREPGFVFYLACQGLVFVPVALLRIRRAGAPRALMAGLLGAAVLSVAGRALAGSSAVPELGQAFASSFAATIAFSLGPDLADRLLG